MKTLTNTFSYSQLLGLIGRLVNIDEPFEPALSHTLLCNNDAYILYGVYMRNIYDIRDTPDDAIHYINRLGLTSCMCLHVQRRELSTYSIDILNIQINK